MKEFTERYEDILKYLKTRFGEEEAAAAMEYISRQYLQQFMQGVHKQRTEEVMEATRQAAYIKSAVERYLETDEFYQRFLFMAGICVGQYKAGEAWLQEQGNADSFERSMVVLCARAHVRDVIEAVYANPGIQHKNLMEIVGVKANYLTQLATSLVEAGCLYRYGTKKCTYYELTLQGKDYVKRTLSSRRHVPDRRRLEEEKYEDWKEDSEKRKTYSLNPAEYPENTAKRDKNAKIIFLYDAASRSNKNDQYKKRIQA